MARKAHFNDGSTKRGYERETKDLSLGAARKSSYVVGM